MQKPEITLPELKTWGALNNALRGANEDLCKRLLAAELKGRKRRMYIMRIHSRLNKARADRERAELKRKVL